MNLFRRHQGSSNQSPTVRENVSSRAKSKLLGKCGDAQWVGSMPRNASERPTNGVDWTALTPAAIANSTATKAHMYCDLFAAEHRDVLHE